MQLSEIVEEKKEHGSSSCSENEHEECTHAHAEKKITKIDKAVSKKIDIATLKWDDFKAYMMTEYGDDVFNSGFKAVKKNKDLLFIIDGKAKLHSKLSHLKFKDAETLDSFVENCLGYMAAHGIRS